MSHTGLQYSLRYAEAAPALHASDPFAWRIALQAGGEAAASSDGKALALCRLFGVPRVVLLSPVYDDSDFLGGVNESQSRTLNSALALALTNTGHDSTVAAVQIFEPSRGAYLAVASVCDAVCLRHQQSEEDAAYDDGHRAARVSSRKWWEPPTGTCTCCSAHIMRYKADEAYLHSNDAATNRVVTMARHGGLVSLLDGYTTAVANRSTSTGLSSSVAHAAWLIRSNHDHGIRDRIFHVGQSGASRNSRGNSEDPRGASAAPTCVPSKWDAENQLSYPLPAALAAVEIVAIWAHRESGDNFSSSSHPWALHDLGAPPKAADDSEEALQSASDRCSSTLWAWLTQGGGSNEERSHQSMPCRLGDLVDDDACALCVRVYWAPRTSTRRTRRHEDGSDGGAVDVSHRPSPLSSALAVAAKQLHRIAPSCEHNDCAQTDFPGNAAKVRQHATVAPAQRCDISATEPAAALLQVLLEAAVSVHYDAIRNNNNDWSPASALGLGLESLNAAALDDPFKDNDENCAELPINNIDMQLDTAPVRVATAPVTSPTSTYNNLDGTLLSSPQTTSSAGDVADFESADEGEAEWDAWPEDRITTDPHTRHDAVAATSESVLTSTNAMSFKAVSPHVSRRRRLIRAARSVVALLPRAAVSTAARSASHGISDAVATAAASLADDDALLLAAADNAARYMRSASIYAAIDRILVSHSDNAFLADGSTIGASPSPLPKTAPSHSPLSHLAATFGEAAIKLRFASKTSLLRNNGAAFFDRLLYSAPSAGGNAPAPQTRGCMSCCIAPPIAPTPARRALLRLLCAYYAAFVRGLRSLWEQSPPASGLPGYSRDKPCVIDVSGACLMEQKLQLLHACMEARAHAVSRSQRTQLLSALPIRWRDVPAGVDTDETVPGTVSVAVNDDGNVAFWDVFDSGESDTPVTIEDDIRLIRVTVMSRTNSASQFLMGPLMSSIGGLHHDDEGSPYASDGIISLAGPLIQVVTPTLAPAPLQTEDEIMSAAAVMARLGIVNLASPRRPDTPSPLSPSLIQADMAAYRAVNTNAALVDFLRWYFPSAWITSTTVRVYDNETRIEVENEPSSLLRRASMPLVVTRSASNEYLPASELLVSPSEIWRALCDMEGSISVGVDCDGPFGAAGVWRAQIWRDRLVNDGRRTQVTRFLRIVHLPPAASRSGDVASRRWGLWCSLWSSARPMMEFPSMAPDRLQQAVSIADPDTRGEIVLDWFETRTPLEVATSLLTVGIGYATAHVSPLRRPAVVAEAGPLTVGLNTLMLAGGDAWGKSTTIKHHYARTSAEDHTGDTESASSDTQDHHRRLEAAAAMSDARHAELHSILSFTSGLVAIVADAEVLCRRASAVRLALCSDRVADHPRGDVANCTKAPSPIAVLADALADSCATHDASEKHDGRVNDVQTRVPSDNLVSGAVALVDRLSPRAAAWHTTEFDHYALGTNARAPLQHDKNDKASERPHASNTARTKKSVDVAVSPQHEYSSLFVVHNAEARHALVRMLHRSSLPADTHAPYDGHLDAPPPTERSTSLIARVSSTGEHIGALPPPTGLFVRCSGSRVRVAHAVPASID